MKKRLVRNAVVRLLKVNEANVHGRFRLADLPIDAPNRRSPARSNFEEGSNMAGALLVDAEARLSICEEVAVLEAPAESFRHTGTDNLQQDGHQTDPSVVVRVGGISLLVHGHNGRGQHLFGDVAVEEGIDGMG